MWLQRAEKWCRGTVTFRAEGGLCERFLNLLTRREAAVSLWDVVREENCVCATMRASDYKAVRAFARRTGTRVHLVEKRGLPFCARPLIKRPGIVVGMVAALVMYTVLASRLWVVDVRTQDEAVAQTVKEALAQNGVSIGAKMNDVDLAAVQWRAIADLKNLHRLSLYFDGSIAHVDVQWDKTGATVPDTAPANIVAAHDGCIRSMQVTSGQATVKTGEAVVAGDLLVCGAVETTAGVLLRHAAARIVAETTHVLEETVMLREPRVRDGKAAAEYTLRFLSFSVPLYSLSEWDDSYRTETRESMMTAFGVTLPVGIVSRVYHKQETVMLHYTQEEAERLARERLEERAARELGEVTVEAVNYDGVWEGDAYRLRATYTCTEDIAKTVPLLIAP